MSRHHFTLPFGIVLFFLFAFSAAGAAPTVTGKTPAAGATWVSEFSPVTATFSEAMNPATITGGSITLDKRVGVVDIAAGVLHTVALKGDGTVVAWGSNSFGEATVPVSPYYNSIPTAVAYASASRTATLTPTAPLPLSSIAPRSLAAQSPGRRWRGVLPGISPPAKR